MFCRRDSKTNINQETAGNEFFREKSEKAKTMKGKLSL
jgi:hypothetical protein